MSRVIKFRAWSTKFGLMVYPDDPTYRLSISNGDIHTVWKDARDDEGVAIMQFTERKDINGKEVYDGDIVRYQWKRGKTKTGTTVTTVEWSRSMWILKKNDTIMHDYAAFNLVKLEVIGNLCENPELLTL